MFARRRRRQHASVSNGGGSRGKPTTFDDTAFSCCCCCLAVWRAMKLITRIHLKITQLVARTRKSTHTRARSIGLRYRLDLEFAISFARTRAPSAILPVARERARIRRHTHTRAKTHCTQVWLVADIAKSSARLSARSLDLDTTKASCSLIKAIDPQQQQQQQHRVEISRFDTRYRARAMSVSFPTCKRATFRRPNQFRYSARTMSARL